MKFKVFSQDSCWGGYFNQTMMTFMINVPIMSFGLTMGWLSPSTLLLQSTATPARAPLTDEVVSWMASVTFLAALPAVLLAGYLADTWGRRPALCVTSGAFALCWLLKLCSTEPWVLITARAIAGVGSSGSFIVTPLYVNEISEERIRGALGSVMVLSQNLGYLLMYVLADVLEYRTVLWGCLVLSLLHAVLFLSVPESPSFLASQNKTKQAIEALAWLRHREVDDELVQKELALIQEEFHQVLTIKSNIKSLVSDRISLKAFSIASMAVLVQELSGMFSLLLYAGVIFERAGVTHSLQLTANQQTMLLGAVQLLGSVLALCFVDKVGRKPLLVSTAFVISACMLVTGVWCFLNTRGMLLPGWIPVLAMCLGVLSDSAGLQPVPYVIMCEMFHYQLRGMVVTIITGFSCVANFVELKVFHPIANALGMHTCFGIFTVVTFLFAIYTIFCIPETMGRTVEEIYEDLRGKGKNKENKKDKKRKNVTLNSNNNKMKKINEILNKKEFSTLKDIISVSKEKNMTQCVNRQCKHEERDSDITLRTVHLESYKCDIENECENVRM